MIPSNDGTAIDPVAVALSEETESLKQQISILKARRRLQVTTLLSAQNSSSVLDRLRNSTVAANLSKPDPQKDSDPLLTLAAKQSLHQQENLYRACASVTTFRIKDPDPNAVDAGNVLALRIDAGSTGKYIRPYYVMLNKPFPGSKLFRVHRHTVPPCIPLEDLAHRYLPTGKGVSEAGEKGAGKQQDLNNFGRALRREIVGYHNRIAVIKSMRKSFALDDKSSRKEKLIADISAADAEAKQIRIEWTDGRIGRFVVDDNGAVQKCVILGEDGRDRDDERRVLGGDARMEGVADRLKEGMYL